MTGKLERLKENLGATSILLDSDVLLQIDDAVSQMLILGDRYAQDRSALAER